MWGAIGLLITLALQAFGAVNGRVIDESGAAIAGARIALTPEGTVPGIETVSDADGRFSFANAPAGSFRIDVSADHFVSRTVTGVVAAGASTSLPEIRLTLSVGSVGVEVTPSRVEVAEQQLHQQEQQRLLGVFPNFRVSYVPNAEPLNARQKFQLTWKSVADPVRFATVGVGAGIQYARNDFSEFGDGFEGYAKRYAALYATILTSTMITNVALPTVFRQDPRYFYKGTGSTSSRLGYALSRAVVRRGDNGRSQPDYSRILGSLTAGAISNFYYPPEHRRDAQLMLTNTAIAIGGAALGNVMQEFVLGHVTTRRPRSTPNAGTEVGRGDGGR
ncbi:MAG TPA: carboxypeptidase-like regulatory domain-containing protein [Vicinamibacterales bacterium]|nr:carboxypeptidase-like regulatory domain-containing protein [Vicinamibacterales bacterium]